MLDKSAVTAVFEALGPERVARGLLDAEGHTWEDLGPQHRLCAISGVPDRSEAWSAAAREMIRSSASRLMSSPGIPSA